MDCMNSRNQMHAYLDQELDLPSVVALDQHLASCPACKALFAQHSALQSGIRKHATYYDAPAGLAERIRARAGAAAPARGSKPGWQWPSLPQWLQIGAAVAATAVVSWTAAIQYTSVAEDDAIAEQVIAAHARSVLTGHLADVASSDQHTVKPWLSSKLDFSPPVTDLTGAGFPLVGGRLDYLDHRPVAALVFRHRQHLIDLFVWPARSESRGAAKAELSRNGFNVVHWRAGDMDYWAISDLNPAEMKDFAQTYASAK